MNREWDHSALVSETNHQPTTNNMNTTDTQYPAPKPNAAKIKQDATSLFKAKWDNNKICQHILLHNGEQDYGVYLTEASVLAIINPLLAELNAEIAADWAAARKMIEESN